MKKLYEARYRALSADIMGNTYEQYLGKTLAQRDGEVVTVDNLETRKKQGSYYTPQVIVRYLVDNSLGRYLYGTANGRPDGEPLPGAPPERRSALRVLDPPQGAALFHLRLRVLAGFHRPRSTAWSAGAISATRSWCSRALSPRSTSASS